MIEGFIVGVVTDNQDPDEMCRVKVQYVVQGDEIESYWARVASPSSGQGFGMVMLPEVGDEVLLAFAYRSLQPYVIGALYNGTDTPPYANDDGDNNLRVYLSRSSHQVVFDDTSGSEAIGIGATADSAGDVTSGPVYQTLNDSDGSKTYADQNITVDAGSSVEINCQDFTVSASMSVTIEASQGATLSSSTVEINGDMSITISGQSGNLG